MALIKIQILTTATKLVDPEDWFGLEDASRMIYSGSPETQRIQDNLMGLIGSLPERHSPPRRFSLKHVTVPDDVKTHVQKLRTTGKGRLSDVMR